MQSEGDGFAAMPVCKAIAVGQGGFQGCGPRLSSNQAVKGEVCWLRGCWLLGSCGASSDCLCARAVKCHSLGRTRAGRANGTRVPGEEAGLVIFLSTEPKQPSVHSTSSAFPPFQPFLPSIPGAGRAAASQCVSWKGCSAGGRAEGPAGMGARWERGHAH